MVTTNNMPTTTCMTVTNTEGNPKTAKSCQMNPPVMKLTNVSKRAKGKKTASCIGSKIVDDPVPFTGVVTC